ncbi:NEDD8-activating enzyme E1 catalytic subunit [Papilio machaon]|uniref:NEDD8-activating enzyme E1 catalytic subunit n=1 Tax=Papilio machaon TaxID=76193 RepID=UPI001E665D6C|nr:NEDD8-activating enzyme E1 catalytic subunit [Papilio machaon]XP_045534793.1 NEDD8-activating enzyme E1 catalytic subunit [Papilio machaon]
MATTETHVPEQQRRWHNIRKLLERSGPFCHPDFEPSPDILDFLMESCKILVVGAGGLGCELLKDLALMGFKKIHIVDMDTIELSNLNRQFLFRKSDIGSSKAKCAVDFVNKRVPGCEAVAHHCAIQDLDEGFYRQFHIIVCGLDSIVARRWLNGMLMNLLQYNDDRSLDQSSVIPLVDGGTEGFKGNARVILPGLSACIECTLDLYPPQKTFPLCTIANTPRLPEHCIEYVKVIQWPKENPWGSSTLLDGDDPQHVGWVFEKAQERAMKHGITSVTYRLTQGVLKNIIPAVASTNAAIAATCATEVFKLASSCCTNMNNYMVLNMADGVYTYTFNAERKPDCVACSNTTRVLDVEPGAILMDIYEKLKEDTGFLMKNPGITTVINGRNKTLYMPSIKSIEERTRDNLKKKITDLGLYNGGEILVADITTPNTISIKLKFIENTDVEMSR